MIYFLLSFLGACAYRVGGSDLHIPHKTKIRDAGVPFVGCLIIVLNNWPLTLWACWVGLFLSFGLAWGAMTTYFKKKETDAKWFNWSLVGLAFGIALFPYAWATGQWMPFLYRTIMTTVFITIWSESIGNAVLEEFGRGFIFCITLLFF